MVDMVFCGLMEKKQAKDKDGKNFLKPNKRIDKKGNLFLDMPVINMESEA